MNNSNQVDKSRQATWIIGASSGIGKALAIAMADEGKALIITARSEDKLQQVAKACGESHVTLAPLDITDNDAVNQAIKTFENKGILIEKVILNAGTCEYIDTDNIDLDAVNRVLSTNYIAPVAITKQLIPVLKQTRKTIPGSDCRLVFVASSVTYQPLPRAGAYGASKAALRYFAESIALDLVHEEITVQVVSPGFVETPLTAQNDFPMPFMISAKQAANIINKGIRGRAFDIHFPYRFTILLKLVSLIPARFRIKLLSRLSRHDGASESVKHQST